jgi:hypothetical protein
LVAKRTGVFLKEFVVLFGFLNGVWLAVGVNPGAEFLAILRQTAESLVGVNGWLEFFFALVPLVLVVAALVAILRKGGILGFVAVLVALFAGMLIVSEPRSSFVLLLAALGLGYLAAR